jgi:hypothetical protein
MPFDWYAFLQLAHFLHRQPSGISMEADQRTLVSRSYYAAFGFVRDYVTGEMPAITARTCPLTRR